MKRFFIVSMLVTAMVFSIFDAAALAKSSAATSHSKTVKPATKTASKTAKKTAKKTTKKPTKKATKSSRKTTSKSTSKTSSAAKKKITPKTSAKSAAKPKTKAATKPQTKTTAKPQTKTAAKTKPVSSRGGNDTFNASKIINYGLTFKGTRYKFGGMSPSGFDCSGFTSYVFKNAAGITLPHSSGGQAAMGSAVAKSDLLPGDIVYFTTYKSGVSHVGIYVGDNKFLHASSSKGITVTSLSDSYYTKRYLGARRIR